MSFLPKSIPFGVAILFCFAWHHVTLAQTADAKAFSPSGTVSGSWHNEQHSASRRFTAWLRSHRRESIGVSGTTHPVRSGVEIQRGSFISRQVNVDANGDDIAGDVANEPSLTVNPTNPMVLSVAWRQFDVWWSDFRQAGFAQSIDGGESWFGVGVLDEGVGRSDPVLDSDAGGTVFYYSLRTSDLLCDLFVSNDLGRSWSPPLSAFGGDKPWMAIDRTTGIGRGNIYCTWQVFEVGPQESFTRSTNGGATFLTPMALPGIPILGTVAVGPDGEVYVAGRSRDGVAEIMITRSDDARHPARVPTFGPPRAVNLGGAIMAGGYPNPGGLMGQVWVNTDRSSGSSRGNVYVLASVQPPGDDPMDVMFASSTDGGRTWGAPVRVNDDPSAPDKWQWFGTMSVAPNGRIDAVWNDTRNDDGLGRWSELFYAYSTDQGRTWSENIALTPPFDTRTGNAVNQQKIGDYYQTRSDDLGVSIAYAATFNVGHDVYFLRVEAIDCNRNGLVDRIDIETAASPDCNGNWMPDECEPDCDGNGVPDGCDIDAAKLADCNQNRRPDICEPNDWDGDGRIDDCDADRDNDGVLNLLDRCPFSPPGIRNRPDGSPYGDVNGDCDLDLSDYNRMWFCVLGPAFDLSGEPLCIDNFEFVPDGHVDLQDVAQFQRGFTGPGLGP